MSRSPITGRLQRLATVSLVPSLVDVGLLVLLRQGLGWVLVVADLVAITAASLLSYALHRIVTFRSDPYVRWVQVPVAFVAVALLAAVVDVVVLRALFAGTGFDSVGGLVAAKLVALAAAAVVRLACYRAVLLVGLTSARQQRSERG
ncbi:MAG TPA: GtrA family protein, partial [Acidimicrobiales bacterium]